MFWWVVTPILAFYLKMSTGVPIDRISHQYEARVCKPFRCARARCEHNGSEETAPR